MKNTAPILLLALFLVPAAAAGATPTPADFSYCAGVQAEVKTDSLYQLHLTPDIIGNAGAGLSDLRLFDSSGKETPFTIIENIPPYEETAETYPLEITGYDAGPSSVVVTLKLPQKHRPISLLDFDIADRDFKKRATLSASRDGKAWQQIAEDTLYDFSSQVDLRKTRLEFARTEARFFRLTLADFAPQAAEQQSLWLRYEGLEFSVNGAQKKELRIRGAKGGTLVPAEKKPVYDHKTFSDLAPVTDKEGNTVIAFAAGLPAGRLFFDVANRYYYRTIQLYGSADGKEGTYRLLDSRPIYRFPLSSEQQEEQNLIEPGLPKYAYYKVVVLNKNNPPLDIRGITLSWVRQDLYFMATRDDERYSLCYGNPHVERPDYDVARFVNRNTLSRYVPGPAAIAAPVKGAGPRPTLRERIAGMEKLTLKVVVALLVVGMGAWLYTLLKKAPEKK